MFRLRVFSLALAGLLAFGLALSGSSPFAWASTTTVVHHDARAVPSEPTSAVAIPPVQGDLRPGATTTVLVEVMSAKSARVSLALDQGLWSPTSRVTVPKGWLITLPVGSSRFLKVPHGSNGLGFVFPVRIAIPRGATSGLFVFSATATFRYLDQELPTAVIGSRSFLWVAGPSRRPSPPVVTITGVSRFGFSKPRPTVTVRVRRDSLSEVVVSMPGVPIPARCRFPVNVASTSRDWAPACVIHLSLTTLPDQLGLLGGWGHVKATATFPLSPRSSESVTVSRPYFWVSPWVVVDFGVLLVGGLAALALAVRRVRRHPRGRS